MQLATIEFARNVCGLKKATSTEFDPKTKQPVIDLIPEQKELIKNKQYGATMRLGAWDCKIIPKTIASKAYKKGLVSERHRHRYEFNNEYRNLLTSKGLVISGINPEKIW